MYFYGSNLRPWPEAILDPGAFIWTKLVEAH